MNDHFKKRLVLLACTTLLSAPSLFAAQNQSVPNIVYSILSYAKWSKASPSICIINNHELADKFLAAQTSFQNYKIINLNISNLKSTQCDSIVFSTFSSREEQQILNSTVNFPSLSISTNNSQCEEGSAFCLYRKNQQLSFKINLESLSRSKVHIDPRVLLLAKQAEQ